MAARQAVERVVKRAGDRSTWFYMASLIEIAVATDVLSMIWTHSDHVDLVVPIALAAVGVIASMLGRSGAVIGTAFAGTVLLAWRLVHVGELHRIDLAAALLFSGTALLLATLAMQRRAFEEQIASQRFLLGEALVQEATLSRAKDDFLSLVAHELRNPVAVIVGAARLLQRNRITPETRQELVHDIAIESTRVHLLIEDLLSLARLEAGLGASPEPVLLQRLVPKAVGEFHERYRNEVRLSIDPALPPASASAVYVERVLGNLLSNAGKYSPAGSPIDVQAHLIDASIAVDVMDHGPGVAADDLGLIFERFHREHPAEQVRGYGLGLTISKRLVEASRGQIWARNRAGGGLDVGFSLPVYRE
jgi:signal transduction histidine kinase